MTSNKAAKLIFKSYLKSKYNKLLKETYEYREKIAFKICPELKTKLEEQKNIEKIVIDNLVDKVVSNSSEVKKTVSDVALNLSDKFKKIIKEKYLKKK